MDLTKNADRRTDLRTVYPHGSYAEVYAAPECPLPDDAGGDPPA